MRRHAGTVPRRRGRLGRVTSPSFSVRQWPGLRTEHAWLPSHDRETTTKPGQIGVAFSGHRGVVYETGGRTIEGDHPPGATIVCGAGPVTWLRVAEPVEALEMYPDPALLDGLPVEPRIGEFDGIVLAVGSRLRRAHATGLSDVAASTLAHRLAEHVVHRYAGSRPPRAAVRRLGGAAVDRVAELVEARLADVLTLDDLAREVALSPYHFHRCFRATTGMAPHEFVTARRMDRARLLVSTTAQPVDRIGAAVGFGNLSHFRRVFRRHHGVPPSALRTPAN
jgi:AraC family transcriptional regulator